MPRFPPGAHVAFTPFASRDEGSYTTIGDPERGVFLTIPSEGRELLDQLAAGSTVGEAVAHYEQAHGETPDVEDFLGALAEHGFVDSPGVDRNRPSASPAAEAAERPRPRAWILSALALSGLATIAGIVLAASDSALLPASTVLVFHRHIAALTIALFACNIAAIAVHELAHLFAARSTGARVRIGVSHRLWFLVAETDMSAIWLAPKRSRYLSFVAGPLIDAASASVLLGLLWAGDHRWLTLSPALAQFTGALLWSYLLRLLWQCFVFVRTDFYYVLATALDCKRLLADTEDLLRNQLSRLRGRPKIVDQSRIPPHERRAIRAYSVAWVAGRAVAVGSLVLITMPVLAGYIRELAATLGGPHTTAGMIDVLTLAGLGLGLQGGGLVVWVRSLLHTRAQRSAR